MKLKSLLKRDNSEEGDEDNHTYFMQDLSIDLSKYDKTSRNQAFRMKIVQCFSTPKICLTMATITTVLNAAIVIWYILYLDRVHDFYDG